MSHALEVHLLTWNEEELLPYTLRHYQAMDAEIFVHDAFSTDRTREICEAFGVVVWDWDTGNQFNDLHALNLKNRCWQGTDARWVVVADIDEFIYCPEGWQRTLEIYEAAAFCCIKPRGFEMYSPTWPTTAGQIYEEVKRGAPSEPYSKPILFSPSRVKWIEFGAGAHNCQYVRKADEKRYEPREITKPESYLLHFHQIGPIERIAAKYDERRKRLAEVNVRNHWGNLDQTGMEHAIAKRDLIVPDLIQVLP